MGFPLVKGWLAVLLGERFEMDRVEGSEFYDGDGISTELRHEEIAIAC